uniref:Ovule protein n=1 Tax=Heterorhabditis bacteriophora TaxID=37862 RepID=A0A1I7WE36_HETBA
MTLKEEDNDSDNCQNEPIFSGEILKQEVTVDRIYEENKLISLKRKSKPMKYTAHPSGRSNRDSDVTTMPSLAFIMAI